MSYKAPTQTLWWPIQLVIVLLEPAHDVHTSPHMLYFYKRSLYLYDVVRIHTICCRFFFICVFATLGCSSMRLQIAVNRSYTLWNIYASTLQHKVCVLPLNVVYCEFEFIVLLCAKREQVPTEPLEFVRPSIKSV